MSGPGQNEFSTLPRGRARKYFAICQQLPPFGGARAIRSIPFAPLSALRGAQCGL